MKAEQALVEALLAWYETNRRSLPWRTTNDPYHILVSEIMLQQTQAARVAPYYQRFMSRFPTVSALSSAPLSDVLALWSGLGYNRRAVQLREAARLIAAEGWPSDAAGLRRLPGVGPYTAAAVACFAFGEQIAAPDTNAKRVLSRWTGSALQGASVDTAAQSLLAEGRAREWNQALMDLGAMLCRPVSPLCGSCPASAWCSNPGIYSPPPAQPKFEGSPRQARGRALRALLSLGEATYEELAQRTGVESPRLERALGGLMAERLITGRDDRYVLAE